MIRLCRYFHSGLRKATYFMEEAACPVDYSERHLWDVAAVNGWARWDGHPSEPHEVYTAFSTILAQRIDQ